MLFPSWSNLLFLLTVVVSVQASPPTTPPSPNETISSSTMSPVQNEAIGFSGVTSPDASDQACTPSHCYGLSYEDLWRFYGGLFMSEADIMSRRFLWMETPSPQQIWWSSTPSSTRRSKRQTRNRCCHSFLRHRYDNQMINTVGEVRHVLHLTYLEPPRYQWYPQVTCLDNSGLCKSENTTVSLLVYSQQVWSWPFEYDTFDVPAHCACSL